MMVRLPSRQASCTSLNLQVNVSKISMAVSLKSGIVIEMKMYCFRLVKIRIHSWACSFKNSSLAELVSILQAALSTSKWGQSRFSNYSPPLLRTNFSRLWMIFVWFQYW